MERLFLLIVVFSGATSLFYEVLWIRFFALVLGSTQNSLSVILSSFFAGMLIGNVLASRMALQTRSSLLIFAVFEFFIGTYNLFLYSGFEWLPKNAVAYLAVLPPAVLMGFSLPLLVAAVPDSMKNAPKVYFLNTLGAGIGSLAVGLILVPSFGFGGALVLASLASLALCLLCFWAWHFDGVTSQRTYSRPANSVRFIWLLTCLLFGFFAIALQVSWAKFLGIYFGSTLIGHSVILAVYLFGIAFGSRVAERAVNPDRFLSHLIVVTPLLVVVTQLSLSYLNDLIFYLSPLLLFVPLWLVKTLLTFAVILPTTMAFGALFPSLIRANSTSKEEIPSGFAIFGAANTVGALASALLVPLYIIPKLGSPSTTFLTEIAVTVCCSIVLIWQRSFSIRNGSVVFVALLLMVGLKRDFYTHLSFGMTAQTHSELISYRASTPPNSAVFLKEGKESVVTLEKRGEGHYILKNDGLPESTLSDKGFAETGEIELTQWLAYLPLIFKDQVNSALVIGYGSGHTGHSLSNPLLGVNRVEIVEIEEGILQASRFVNASESITWGRENVSIVIDDARSHLTKSREQRYDVIASQPSHSWKAGTASLFTKEFFEIVESRLTTQGIFTQWISVDRLDEISLKSLLRTFYGVFPYGSVFFKEHDGEYILLGSKAELKWDEERVQRVLNASGHLTKSSDAASRLLGYFSTSRKRVLEYAKGSVQNTDWNTLVEMRQNRFVLNSSQVGRIHPDVPLAPMHLPEWYPIMSEDRFVALIQELDRAKQDAKFDVVYETFFKRLAKRFRKNPSLLKALADTCFERKMYSCAISSYSQLMDIKSGVEYLEPLLMSHYFAKSYKAASGLINEFRQVVKRDRCLELWSRSLLGNAIEKKSIQECPDRYSGTFGGALEKAGDSRGANEQYFKYYLKHPDDLENVMGLMRTYLKLGEKQKFSSYAVHFEALVIGDLREVANARNNYLRRGFQDKAKLANYQIAILENLQSEFRELLLHAGFQE